MKVKLMSGLEPALESIDFQDDKLFRQMADAFKDNKKKIDDDSLDTLADTLSKLIKHYTNITVTFKLEDYYPAVQVPDLNRNSPIIQGMFRQYMTNADAKKMIKNAEDVLIRGKVNLRQARVEGAWAEVDSPIYFPKAMINGQYTPEECSAIILHEVGHIFVMFEFIARTVTTNQVLAGISRMLDTTDSVDEREVILTMASKALKIDPKYLDIKELAKSNNKTVVETVIVTNMIKSTESELGSNIYDMNNFEMLADQFATRMGAGRALVTGLARLHVEFGDIAYRSRPMFYALEALKIVLLVGSLALLGTSLAAWGALGFFGWASWCVCDGMTSEHYDRPGVRSKRVRNQIVEQLKNPKLSKEDIQRLKDDLAVIDNVLTEVEDKRQLMTVIANFFSSFDRSRLSAEKLQQELETLAANQLFVKSAELKALA